MIIIGNETKLFSGYSEPLYSQIKNENILYAILQRD
jgi:hypothetical protein